MSTQKLAKVALIAAVYVILTVLPPFAALSYGPIQVRVAEALTVLPFITPLAIPGLFLGCFIANLGSPFLAYDLTIGPVATLLAAFLTSRMPRPYWAPLPPVVINAVLVSAYVAPLAGFSYLPVAGYIALGQLVACYGLGYPLLAYVRRRPELMAWLSR
ncbi:MAG: QueT transporter family protein [Bacillota bacterium]